MTKLISLLIHLLFRNPKILIQIVDKNIASIKQTCVAMDSMV